MAENFLALERQDRAAVLRAAGENLGRSPGILEKDIWVCWALSAVFGIPEAPRMAFKGGTSLSKIYGAIDRFSEDIDITIDYASLLPGFDPFDEKLSGNQRRVACEELVQLAIAFVKERAAPYLADRLTQDVGREGAVEIVSEGEAIRINYQSSLDDPGANPYLANSVLIEFGGRNTTQPMQQHQVVAFVAPHSVDLTFPAATVPVLAGERTFWEKATLIHVECHRDDFEARVERKSRHWYDLARLADHAIGKAAVADFALLADVVRHKKVFFMSAMANYEACISGGLRLVPAGDSRVALEADYQAMERSGMFDGKPPPMKAVLDRLEQLERVVNEAHAAR